MAKCSLQLLITNSNKNDCFEDSHSQDISRPHWITIHLPLVHLTGPKKFSLKHVYFTDMVFTTFFCFVLGQIISVLISLKTFGKLCGFRPGAKLFCNKLRIHDTWNVQKWFWCITFSPPMYESNKNLIFDCCSTSNCSP